MVRDGDRMFREQVTKKTRVRMEETLQKKRKEKRKKKTSIQNQTGFFNGATTGEKSEPSGEP